MRGPNVSYQLKLAAMAIVAPTRDRLGEWSKQSAHIVGIARLGRGHNAALAEQAKALLNSVEVERQHLLARIQDQPDAIRKHTRVNDALRSLDALKATLAEAAALLAPSEGYAQ